MFNLWSISCRTSTAWKIHAVLLCNYLLLYKLVGLHEENWPHPYRTAVPMPTNDGTCCSAEAQYEAGHCDLFIWCSCVSTSIIESKKDTWGSPMVSSLGPQQNKTCLASGRWLRRVSSNAMAFGSHTSGLSHQPSLLKITLLVAYSSR